PPHGRSAGWSGQASPRPAWSHATPTRPRSVRSAVLIVDRPRERQRPGGLLTTGPSGHGLCTGGRPCTVLRASCRADERLALGTSLRQDRAQSERLARSLRAPGVPQQLAAVLVLGQIELGVRSHLPLPSV